MKRGRKCHYGSCDHNEGNNKISGRTCKFFSMPKDRIKATQWLHSGGVYHLTPKRITAHNCFFCSCHFSKGKENGPDEYLEECDWDENVNRKRSQVAGTQESPAVKSRRVSELTPSTKLALDGLMSLAADHVSLSRAPSYSPKRLLWKLRGSQARGSCRQALSDILDCSTNQDLSPPPSRNSFSSSLCEMDVDDNNNDNVIDSKISMNPSTTSAPTQPGYQKKLHFKDEDGSPITYDESLFSDLGVTPLSCPPSPAPNDGHATFDVNGGSQQRDENNEMQNRRSIGIQCNRSFLSYDKCKMLPEKEFMFYTGVTQKVFEMIYTFIGGDEVCNNLKYKYNNSTPKREYFNPDLTSMDKMFLTLLRLRRGLPLADLKIVFKISETHCSRITYTWIRFLSLQFSKLDRHMFTSVSAQQELKPKCFEPFPNLRVIIDATEFKIQHPRHFQQQNNTFSQYKKSNTIKFLVGISCFGGLSFLSEAYEGSISDAALVVKSGLLNYLEPQEAVMADRGFDIEDLCDEKEVHLIIPAFTDGRTHFTARELIYNRAIAVSRIHVETFIGKIKQYRLIRFVIPNKMLPIASDLVKVCAYLVNFQLPFIKKDDDPECD